ncbi:MAG: glycosyltransferase [Eubacteriales bacterium]|jgi:glycosyltransferase involved in cell wall biosynthesis
MMFDHTFAICAYKESEFLENCIQSLKKQTLKTNIIMSTSTPNDHITSLAEKYDIPLYIRDGKSNLKDDWNFAYNHAETKWVTIAHQDDQYAPTYAESIAKRVENVPDAIAAVTDYIPIKHGEIGKRDKNSKIRHFLRTPLKNMYLCGTHFWKRAVLSLGNSICCPSVTYNKEALGESFFTSDLQYNIDWDTFLKIADTKGKFVYVDQPLTFYRVYDGATSKEFIENHKREKDDIAMFKKFWPDWVVRIIMTFYKSAYNTYSD